jgi:drug/metabolite transporter (DMT)-like permease
MRGFTALMQMRKVLDYMPTTRPLAPITLLMAATTWGLIWYPFRLLEADGLSGSVSSLLTYVLGLPFLFWLAWQRGRLASGWQDKGQRLWLLAVAITSGWTNLSYVLAVIHGEVMRVMLLFYLAPLWTVLFAWLILREHAGVWGWAVISLALGGAYVMLAQGEQGFTGWPLPASGPEWLGLSAGIGFALSNVLTRKARDIPIETRTLWVFAGVALMAGVSAGTEPGSVEAVRQVSMEGWWIMGGITLALLLATFSVQYGLAHIPANLAVVILLFELVAAALGSYLLAGEHMGPREWLGGGMVVAATLFSLKLKYHD